MSWEKVRLGDLATFVNGYAFKPTDWSDHGLEIIRIQNLTKSGAKANYFSDNISDKYKVVKGDILISWSATLGVFEWKGADAWLNQHIFKVVFDKEEIDKSFFVYLIEHILDDLKSRVHGATMKHITKGNFDNTLVPLPPLPIQAKIATILDKADALRRKDQELLKKYDELAQAIFIDMFGDPVKNEKGWEVKRLGEVCSKIGSGSTPKGGKEAYKSKGISLIRSLNIHQNEFKYKDLAFIDDEQAYLLRNVIVEPNDVLFNITGASVCRTTIVPDQVLPARVNQHVAILRPNQLQLKSDYFVRLLNNQNMNRLLYGIATQGGATREAITKEQLEKLEIPIPPLHLQETFAKKIELINQLKTKVNAEKSEELFQSLLQRAFKGQLITEADN